LNRRKERVQSVCTKHLRGWEKDEAQKIWEELTFDGRGHCLYETGWSRWVRMEEDAGGSL
jgi:hypothetical protein